MKDALISLISPLVVVAIIAAVGAYFTARAALADVVLKRRLETAQRFTELAEVANNQSGKRGAYEMVAALELLASFGRDELHLRDAARAVLRVAADRAEGDTPGLEFWDVRTVADTAKEALKRLPER